MPTDPASYGLVGRPQASRPDRAQARGWTALALDRGSRRHRGPRQTRSGGRHMGAMRPSSVVAALVLGAPCGRRIVGRGRRRLARVGAIRRHARRRRCRSGGRGRRRSGRRRTGVAVVRAWCIATRRRRQLLDRRSGARKRARFAGSPGCWPRPRSRRRRPTRAMQVASIEANWSCSASPLARPSRWARMRPFDHSASPALLSVGDRHRAPHCSTSSRAIGRPSPVPLTPCRPARPR